MSSQLPEGYYFEEMSPEEFHPLWRHHGEKIFDQNSQIFRAAAYFSEEEKTKIHTLGESLGQPYVMRLGLFHGEEFVGWHLGRQEDASTFYMTNSAILPEHRRKGLYKALLAEVMKILKEKGFQRIYSRHNMTNNSVIIPKLKAGFVITGTELSDNFGALVHLTYLTNPLRRKVLDYRSGETRPDEEIKKVFDF